jgi:NAD(P)-dependent dehydrogenase (short-subunit alcohol dehydrogenase family)
MAINLKGPVFLSQLVVRQMLRQPEKGMVINIGSISSDTASINRAEYCLSKAGVTMLTRLLAVRLAGEAIPVYEVSPGIIETDMTATVHSKYDALIGQGLLPIPRWGQPEDVAAAVSLLASGRLGYSTGECLHVDGGFHLRRL